MPKKETRFQDLIKTSGRPEIVSLWTDPRSNRSFMNAVKQKRVLTLLQEPASKRKDFGRIGFHPQPHASYLVFPEPLTESQGARVIGINYDLINAPAVKDPVRAQDPGISSPARKPSRRKTKPVEKEFHAVVRKVASIETLISVGARNKEDARQKALQRAKNEPFDLSRAIIQAEIRSIK